MSQPDEITECKEQALFRYTWPGKPEAYACINHATKILAVANAMGLPLQMIQLHGIGEYMNQCSYKVKK